MTALRQYTVGDRVARLCDGSGGIVKEVRGTGNVAVLWDANGLETVITPHEIRPA
jgi:hypothetical protein